MSLLDNFTGTNGTNLSAHTSDSGNTWAGITNTSNLFLSGSNAVYSSDVGGNPGQYVSNFVCSTNDTYTCTLKILSTVSGALAGIQARVPGTATETNFTGYLWRATTTTYVLYRGVNNAYTTLGTWNQVPVTGDVMSLTISNSGGNAVLTAKVNGTTASFGVITDTSALTTAGSCGVIIYGGGATNTTGMQISQFTAANNAGYAAGILTLVMTGTLGAPSLNLTTTSQSAGTPPYNTQFQRAPDVSGSPGTYANIGPNSGTLTYSDTTGTIGTLYWYRAVQTDSASNSANTNAIQILYRPGGTYYFAASGSDSNSGTSTGSPWQTITKANSYGMVGGDTFNFNSGDTFSGNLVVASPTGAQPSSAGFPVTVTRYGTLANPVISCGDGHGVKVQNLSYVTVNSLTITGSGVTYTGTTGYNGSGTVSYTTSGFGVFFVNTGTTQLIAAVINGCTVSGCYIGILVSGNGTASPNGKGYTGMRITNNTVHDCAYMGIQTINWPNGPLAGSPDWSAPVHVDTYVGYNTVYHIYGNWTGSAGGNCGYPYYMASNNGGMLEQSIGYQCGFACSPTQGGVTGCELVTCTNFVVQFCEFHNITSGAFTADGSGVDFDGLCVNCIIRYNYVHDCAGTAFEQGDSVGACSGNSVHHNLAINNARTYSVSSFVQSFDGQGDSCVVYNNTVVNAISGIYALPVATPNYTFVNNLFVISGGGGFGNGMNGGNVLQGNYYDVRSGSTFQVGIGGTTYTSLAALQAAGYEVVNGAAVGGSGNSGVFPFGTYPTGVLPSAPVTTITTFDPPTSSPLIGLGVDPLVVAGFQSERDFHGLVSRTQPSSTGVGVTIGAVAYAAGALVGSGLPATSHVQAGTVYGSAGNLFTGTLSGGGGGSGLARTFSGGYWYGNPLTSLQYY